MTPNQGTPVQHLPRPRKTNRKPGARRPRRGAPRATPWLMVGRALASTAVPVRVDGMSREARADANALAEEVWSSTSPDDLDEILGRATIDHEPAMRGMLLAAQRPRPAEIGEPHDEARELLGDELARRLFAAMTKWNAERQKALAEVPAKEALANLPAAVRSGQFDPFAALYDRDLPRNGRRALIFEWRANAAILACICAPDRRPKRPEVLEELVSQVERGADAFALAMRDPGKPSTYHHLTAEEQAHLDEHGWVAPFAK